MIPKLRFEQIAPAAPLHGALIDARAARAMLRVHTHDFCEFFFVLQGHGVHRINGASAPLAPGSLWFIRPEDEHGFRPRAGLTWANVAFRRADWEGFMALAGLDARDWMGVSSPTRDLPADAQPPVRAAFLRAIHAYAESAKPLDLVRFLGEASSALAQVEPSPEPDDLHWLALAMTAMERAENLTRGLPRMVEIAGVSLPHLCRTMRARHGKSPTEFINELRLRRAATLLIATPMNLAEVADDVGLPNLSYFHRLFRRRFGESPLAYRARETGRVL